MTRPNSPTHHHSSSRRHWMICIICVLVGYLNFLFLTNYAAKQSFVSTASSNNVNCNTAGFKYSSSQSTSSTTNTYPTKKVSKLLPDRLIAVFGLESSGTTFTTMALAKALGFKDATHEDFERGKFRMIDPNSERSVEIQHFSLPWGSYGASYPMNVRNQMPPTIPFVPPQECMIQSNQFGRNIPQTIWDSTAGNVIDFNKYECEKQLRINENGGKVKTPLRWFLDVTSHIQWYSERGVDATAVVVVRDTSIHFHGVYKNHVLNNRTAAEEQHQVGLSIINKALRTLTSSHNSNPPPGTTKNDGPSYFYPNGGGTQSSPQLLLVSYETLMSLKEPYLKSIYEQLHISSGYIPSFHDGNSKYVIPVKEDEQVERR